MNEIKRLLEKYFLAETTLEEEKVLADYFRAGLVDADLLRYAAFFEYIDEEKRVSPGGDFEEKILKRVGLLAETAQAGGGMRWGWRRCGGYRLGMRRLRRWYFVCVVFFLLCGCRRIMWAPFRRLQ